MMFYPIHLLALIVFTFMPDPSANVDVLDDYCIHEEDNNLIQNCRPQEGFSFSTDPHHLSSFEELIVPVVFWGVNRDDGTSDDALTQEKVNESIALLNSAFEIMKIKFILKKFKSINCSDIYWTDYSSFNRYVRKDSLSSPDALNIYIPYKFTNFNDNLRGGKWSWNQLGVNMLNYNTGILPHEVGHIFGLNHTHSGFKSKNCERVTRDENDPDYNAHCSGDRVTDTNAMPILYKKFHLINDDCEYNGKLKNCKGELYNITEDDVRNFMGYTQHDCRSKFTIGQAIRAREYIIKFSARKRYDYLITE